MATIDEANVRIENVQTLHRPAYQVLAENELFRKLIATLLFSVTDPVLKSTATDFAKSICRHFALATISRYNNNVSNLVFDPVKDLDSDLFFDAIIDVYNMEMGDSKFSAAESALEEFIDCIFVICNYNEDMVNQLSCWEKLASRLCHCW